MAQTVRVQPIADSKDRSVWDAGRRRIDRQQSKKQRAGMLLTFIDRYRPIQE
jgi:hypothetical protein